MLMKTYEVGYDMVCLRLGWVNMFKFNMREIIHVAHREWWKTFRKYN